MYPFSCSLSAEARRSSSIQVRSPRVPVGRVRLTWSLLVAGVAAVPPARAADAAPKCYLTIEVAFDGSAVETHRNGVERPIEFRDYLGGTTEVRPTPRGGRIQWYPRRNAMRIEGGVSHRARTDSTLVGEGGVIGHESLVETFDGTLSVMADLGNAVVTVRPADKRYDLEFLLMVDMASPSGDSQVIWFAANGGLFERPSNAAAGGRPIVAMNEHDANLTPAIIAEAEVAQITYTMEMGSDQGQHSGFANCVMRYDCAQTYVYRARNDVRVYGFSEPVGGALCTAPAGTGVNAATHIPQSRYGAAQQNRGGCVHQILVSDAIDAPPR